MPLGHVQAGGRPVAPEEQLQGQGVRRRLRHHTKGRCFCGGGRRVCLGVISVGLDEAVEAGSRGGGDAVSDEDNGSRAPTAAPAADDDGRQQPLQGPSTDGARGLHQGHRKSAAAAAAATATGGAASAQAEFHAARLRPQEGGGRQRHGKPLHDRPHPHGLEPRPPRSRSQRGRLPDGGGDGGGHRGSSLPAPLAHSVGGLGDQEQEEKGRPGFVVVDVGPATATAAPARDGRGVVADGGGRVEAEDAPLHAARLFKGLREIVPFEGPSQDAHR